MELYGIKVCLSSAHHPETDGQTERYNRTLEQYLRCFLTENHDNWVELLPLAQLNVNNSHHESIDMTPFKAQFGYQPSLSPAFPSQEVALAAKKK